MSPHYRLPAWSQTHGCQLAGERPFVFHHARESNTLPLQPVGLGTEVRLISSGQNYDVHTVVVRLRERLADGVRELRFPETVTEIAAHDGVMTQHVRLDARGGAALSRDRVVEKPSRVMVWLPTEVVKIATLGGCPILLRREEARTRAQ